MSPAIRYKQRCDLCGRFPKGTWIGPDGSRHLHRRVRIAGLMATTLELLICFPCELRIGEYVGVTVKPT